MNAVGTTCVLIVLACSVPVSALVTAESHFNPGDGGDGRDGWIGNYPGDGYAGADPGDSGGYVIWDGGNGLPPGCLNNYEPAILYTDGFVAPSKFLGDWRGNESIVFDYKKGTFVGAHPFNVRIRSGETDFWVFDVISRGDLDWHEYVVPLEESLWRHSEGSKSWEETLSNITEFFISGDVYIGRETNYLDNVVLSAPEVPSLPISIDIKPGSCPNPLNVKDKGLLSVAILGSADLDVWTIDVASIRLKGVAPVRSSFEDVATPVADGAQPCECTTAGPDGVLDLTLKFNIQDIVAVLGQVNNGDELELTLTGVLDEVFGGTPIEGTDCIVIQGAK